MPIRLTGLSSGLDTESIISALVSSYSYKTNKYKKAQTKLSWKQDAWKSLNTKVYSLYTGLDSLRFSKNYNLKSTTVSDSTKAKVTASSDAPNGTQTLKIKTMAQAGYLTGGKLSSSTTTGTTLAELGYTGGDGKIDLTMGDGTTKSVTVSQGTTVNDFLKSLKDAGVNASYDTTNNRIYVSAKETGKENDFNLTGANVDGANALYALGLSVDSKATSDAYASYTQYYKADGSTQANVEAKLAEFQSAQNTYNTANAQNNNMAAAYSYATAYSSVQDAIKELQANGMSKEDADKLVKILGMSSSERSSSIMTSDGTVYSKQGTDEDGNAIYSYKEGDNTRFIKAITTYQGSDGNVYTYDSDKKTYSSNGTEYKATGKKGADGKALYADADGNEVTIKADVSYYSATEQKQKIGIQYTDKSKKTYTPNDDGTYKGSDGKLYQMQGSGADQKLVEVTKADDGTITEVSKGKSVLISDTTGEDYYKTSYTTGSAISGAQTVSDKLSELQKTIQANDTSLDDKALSSMISTLSSNISAVNTYGAAEDTVLGASDDYSRVSIAANVKQAYAAGGASDVTAYTSTFAAKISANNADIQNAETTMKDNQVLSSIVSITDPAEQAQAITDFVTKVNEMQAISSANGSLQVNSDAKKIDGTDAEITLNGIDYTGSSNSFTINGLTIDVMGVTGSDEKDAISITTKTDTQGMYDKIKDFLTQYNSLINELTSLYNADSAKGYEPLTDEEKDAMSDTEVEKWEQKIKDSLLRRDDTVDSLINTMTTSMSKTYEINGKKYNLSSFGISTMGFLNAPKNQQYAYHIDGDEDDANTSGNTDKLMAAITNDPDTVVSFMQQLTNDLYTEIGKKMKSSSLSSIYTVYNDKEMASEYSDYTDLIKKWEDKLSEKEDYYYKKFSSMETAMAKLNSQSSSFSNYFGS